MYHSKVGSNTSKRMIAVPIEDGPSGRPQKVDDSKI